jgi:hypothetical protein
MSQTIIPKSDQLNAEDLLSGPRTVTITDVRRGSAEQPVDIHLAEFDRPFKPSKTVRRILVMAWGVDAATYVGRSMTIYRDPAVKFGGMDVGGIRISHLSDIDKRFTVALTVTKGRRAPYVVEPLAAPPARKPEPKTSQPNFPSLIRAAKTREALLELFERAKTAGALTDELKAAFKARGEKLSPAAEPAPAEETTPAVDAEIVDPEEWLASQQPPSDGES